MSDDKKNDLVLSRDQFIDALVNALQNYLQNEGLMEKEYKFKYIACMIPMCTSDEKILFIKTQLVPIPDKKQLILSKCENIDLKPEQLQKLEQFLNALCDSVKEPQAEPKKE